MSKTIHFRHFGTDLPSFFASSIIPVVERPAVAERLAKRLYESDSEAFDTLDLFFIGESFFRGAEYIQTKRTASQNAACSIIGAKDGSGKGEPI